ncbi:MAG TPA: hypothetical protein VFE33_02425 [Thermoanaerobaculia bacterium]|nr:hypothetical protein [Thermoanaerobaculia bacterium]
MAGGHDQLWKDLLQTFPGDFLRLAAPRIASSIDLASLAPLPAESWTDLPQGARRQPDLLLRASPRRKGEPAVLLHVEIELRFRSTLPARLWRYNRVLGLRHDLPVHSLVLYLRGGPAGPQTGVYREGSGMGEIARFRYQSLGLSGAPAERYIRRPEPLAWALAALMRWPTADTGEDRRACLRRIAAAPGLNPAKRFLLFNCVATYLEWDGRAEEELQALLAERGQKEVQTMMTWAEKREARAVERGQQEGLEKGLDKGRQKGMQEILMELLRERFRALPPETARRVEAITSPGELSRLARRVLSAGSLEELGLA